MEALFKHEIVLGEAGGAPPFIAGSDGAGFVDCDEGDCIVL